jgi:multidrug efflux pump subunit AcrA (membrane-fusion protein)
MIVAIIVIIAACALFWLVFFKLKLLRLTPAWGIVYAFFVLHLFLVFMIGLRFVTPNSANATVVQHTIQLVPRLPEPTLVTAILVEENAVVKKGQPLFQFDRRPYEYKVEQIKAQLAEAKQNVDVLRADVDISGQKALRTKVELDYLLYQKAMFDKLAQQGAVREEDVVQWTSRTNSAEATRDEALGELERARLKYKSEIDGINHWSRASRRNSGKRSIIWTTRRSLRPKTPNHQPPGSARHGVRYLACRRDRGADSGRRPLSARDILPGEPQIRASGSICRSRV